jgi:hypothetical protein
LRYSRIYADFAPVLISTARPLYADDLLAELYQNLHALDSTTISACRCFPGARFPRHKVAVKMHTLLDLLHGSISTFIRVTKGKTHDVNILDQIIPEAGSFYVMNRGCVDFERLYLLTRCSAFFVVRSKENILLQRRYSHPVDRSNGVRSDHTVILTAIESAKVYPDALRRVTHWVAIVRKRLRLEMSSYQNSTDFESHALRENAHFYGPWKQSTPKTS